MLFPLPEIDIHLSVLGSHLVMLPGNCPSRNTAFDCSWVKYHTKTETSDKMFQCKDYSKENLLESFKYLFSKTFQEKCASCRINASCSSLSTIGVTMMVFSEFCEKFKNSIDIILECISNQEGL